MKFVILTLTILASSVSFASGFRCEGQGYRVKVYNEVQPSRGTKNPAILVVSSDQAGTIATLQGADLEKVIGPNAVSLSGIAHEQASGQFMHVELIIAKAASQTVGYEGTHFAALHLSSGRGNWSAKLACVPYLKGARN